MILFCISLQQIEIENALLAHYLVISNYNQNQIIKKSQPVLEQIGEKQTRNYQVEANIDLNSLV